MAKLIILGLLLTSCSSLRKSKLYASIGGSITSAYIGSRVAHEVSPNKKSDGLNQVIGIVSGGIIGYILGNYAGEYFYHDDPNNFKDTPIRPYASYQNEETMHSLPNPLPLTFEELKK